LNNDEEEIKKFTEQIFEDQKKQILWSKYDREITKKKRKRKKKKLKPLDGEEEEED
jgi:hypothetical protein